jgi:phosphonoacetaldehyde hydrolase
MFFTSTIGVLILFPHREHRPSFPDRYEAAGHRDSPHPGSHADRDAVSGCRGHGQEQAIMNMLAEHYKRDEGPVGAVIFDWAGTTVDYGSMAPVDAFIELFRRHGVTVTAEQARRPMGKYKRDHVRLILDMVRQQWEELHGAAHDISECAERLYQEFIPLQTEVIGRHTDVIPGVADTMEWLKQQNIRVGSTTGYTREMMRGLLPAAAAGGFAPQSTVCADEVPAGRPAPWMAIISAMQLGVYPISRCVKVGDTRVDIEEGRNAGMWTVGVTKTGNELGLTLAEVQALDPQKLAARLKAASGRFFEAGAHYVVEEAAKLPAIITEVSDRLARGERP